MVLEFQQEVNGQNQQEKTTRVAGHGLNQIVMQLQKHIVIQSMSV